MEDEEDEGEDMGEKDASSPWRGSPDSGGDEI